MGFESSILRGNRSESVKAIYCDYSSKISSDFTCWRISRTLRPFENLTLKVKQGSAVFNSEQWIGLDCIGLSSIRNLNQLRSELRIVSTDDSKDMKLSVCHFYPFILSLLLLRAEVLWSSKKPASMCPNVLSCEMTEFILTQLTEWGRSFSVMWLQYFLSSISYLRDELAASFICCLTLRLCQHNVCEADTGFVWALCGSNGCQL